MKVVFLFILYLFLCMLTFFVIFLLFAYWYECGHPYCQWEKQTRANVVCGAALLGSFFGTATFLIYLSQKDNR